ncbi:DUF4410 domain-containing protein [Pseudomonas sp. F(2018)]|uniref:DUF4410 domain-containing protein n=1 Tax=Pseudomonas sp. F(2018) TaxID=2502240 RepID=UPI0010F93F2B|nr:DUF4410 domain-containing protein [Pseudomonas sp. F(2018)]
MRATITMLAVALLTGCAAQVDTSATSGDLIIDKPARRNVLVSLNGSEQAESNESWQDLRHSLHSNLDDQAFHSLYRMTHVAERRTIDVPGVLVSVDVTNFRYLSQIRRSFLGPTTGNAWVDAKVAFYDLQSGELLGNRTYRTTSSGWGTFFSNMTERQVQALSAKIIDEIMQADEPPYVAANAKP